MDLLRRLAAAPRSLGSDQQLAGLAALGLLLSMFLPWYEKNVVDPRGGRFVSDSVSAFGTFSFVEAAVFLVSAGVLLLLFTRSEGRAYELPGGDGTVIMGAGVWAALLLFWRVFDRPDVAGEASTVGIQWGFFVAFVAAGALASSGWRMRQHERASRPESPPRRRPRSPREEQPPPPDEDATLPVRRTPHPAPPPGEEPTVRDGRAADAEPDRLF